MCYLSISNIDMGKVVRLLLVCIFMVANADRSKLPPTCDSLIYCYGPLLDTVQMAGLYDDSKTFVDMKLKNSSNVTLSRFYSMMNRTNNKPNKQQIQEFVDENFDREGSEFEDWTPVDWTANPEFLQRIKDPQFHKWAAGLNELWLHLGRKMKSEVENNQDLYSIIYVKNPVIVPGGRFREFYYWDSYWIIKGLLLSQMRTTARGMVANFLDIVDRVGFIPNGGRIYYAMRSQPPLLIPMVQAVLEGSDDEVQFLEQHIATMDKEFAFWMNNHTVEVEHDDHRYILARYNDQSQGPRPESYREDIDCAKGLDTSEKKEELYAEIKSAAESGWDFSSRWFIQNGTNKGNLTHLKTRSIIPVDLNAILCWNAALMRDFHAKLGNEHMADMYTKVHDSFMNAIDKVLWHDDVGVWLDYNMESGRRRDYFYPSNVAPLWTGCYDRNRTSYYTDRVINYLDKAKVGIFLGGIPTTFEHSGEQWDYPNAWPPLQYMVVMGLADTGLPEAKRLAYEMATKWVRSNFKVWKNRTAMLEKYDATIFGSDGGGGEYQIQTGFGWTNGVIMELLNKYGDTLSAADGFGDDNATTPVRGVAAHVAAGSLATSVLVVSASLVAGLLGLMVYRKRKEVLALDPSETAKLLPSSPYAELRSMEASPRQR